MDELLLRPKDVVRLLRISRPTLYRLVRDGKFPVPMHIGSSITCWKISSVLQWIESQAATPPAP